MTNRHVVMWSGGITSWATARHVIQQHGTASTTLLFADTNAEDPDLYRWNDEASKQLGVPITRVADARERTPMQVFEDKRWLGNTRLAQCALELKLKPCEDWLAGNPELTFDNTTLYVGLDWSEPQRIPGNRASWLPWRTEYPLTEPPYWDKAQLFTQARDAGLEIPRLYELGFAHNNCGGGCVKGGVGQWTRLLKVFPELYARHEAFEQRMRTTLGKDVSILRDRTGGATKPLTLAALRQRIEEQPDQLDLFDEGGCGCFTETLAGAA